MLRSGVILSLERILHAAVEEHNNVAYSIKIL